MLHRVAVKGVENAMPYHRTGYTADDKQTIFSACIFERSEAADGGAAYLGTGDRNIIWKGPWLYGMGHCGGCPN